MLVKYSSVDGIADLRTGGHWFNPMLCQYSFRGLMIVISTGFLPFSPLSVFSAMVMWKSSQWLEKNIVPLKELQDSMDRCTGRRDKTETLLKMTLTHSHTMTPFYAPGKQAF